jgi:hypothetical protein
LASKSIPQRPCAEGALRKAREVTAATRTTIEQLLEANQDLWRGFQGATSLDHYATGFAELDAILPSHGWPACGLIEVISRQCGVGELQVLLPLMRSLIASGRWIVWVAPPYSPYAPGLAQAGIDLSRLLIVGRGGAPAKAVPAKDALWSMEKALQTHRCGLVLGWHNTLAQKAVRRLQLAAVTGGTLGVLFTGSNSEHSPSSLRLQIKDSTDNKGPYAEINVIKARGSFKPGTARVRLFSPFAERVIR